MLADSTQLCFGLWSPFYFCWFAVQSSGSVVQILVWPILMHENSAANMEHFPVSVQHKGKSLNPRAVFHMPLSVLYVVPNFYGCSKEKVLSVLLVMSKRTLSYMVHDELWLGDYVSIFASGCMSLWPSWVQEDNQHQPWPPPAELRFTIYAAELGPVQWPLFDMLERFSVMCQPGQIWKLPWHVPLQQETIKLQPSQIVDVFGQKIPETSAWRLELAWLVCTFPLESRQQKWTGASTEHICSLRALCIGQGLYTEHEFLQFAWDPGASILLHRLGGKPNLKGRGMLGISYDWAVMWAWACYG